MRGIFFSADAGAGAAAEMPVTFIVTLLVSVVVLGPRTVKVYVVDAVGDTGILPRGRTRPTPGSSVTPEGFSVDQVRITGFPGTVVSGWAVKLMIRAGS